MKLWIDDIREAPIDYTLIAANYHEAIALIDLHYNEITHISFDNDLGELSVDENGKELSGYDIIAYIEEKYMLDLMEFKSLVGLQAHSSNYWGRERIYAAMIYIASKHTNYIKCCMSPYETMTDSDAFGFKLKQ